MDSVKRRIVTFFGSYHALKAERILKKEGVTVEILAAPRQISTDCGICIRFQRADEQHLTQILKYAAIEINGLYDE